MFVYVDCIIFFLMLQSKIATELLASNTENENLRASGPVGSELSVLKLVAQLYVILKINLSKLCVLYQLA